jgi:cyclopropane fatty-acyl-phospholipid synthase-like methyltransferase
MEKEHFIETLRAVLGITGKTKILELGSGQSRAVLSLLDKFPEMTYVGIEPNKKDAELAQSLLKKFPHAKVFNRLAYEKIEKYDNFEICISLSVLEHVKQLKKFLAASVASVKTGGQKKHRYDLGHALYQTSLKEKIQVYCGNHFPRYLPENKFARYVNQKLVCEMLEKSGAEIQNVTYHQMPSHKAFLKHFKTDTPDKRALAAEILLWEDRVSKFLPEMNEKTRELIFPTVAIWAQRE